MNKLVAYISFAILSIFLMSILLRVFVCDCFIIRGDSMYPEYFDGEKIWVNKLLAGPRIYTKFDFESPELHSVRLTGIRDIKAGDVVVFNCLISARIFAVYGVNSLINIIIEKRCICYSITIGLTVFTKFVG